MKILFVTNLPSPYRVDFFNELSNYCLLTVLYERHSSAERDEAWVNKEKRKFNEIYADLKPLGVDSSIGFDLVNKIKNLAYDRIIMSGYSSPSVILAIIYCRLKNIPYIMEDDGGLFSEKQERFSSLKKMLLKKTRAYFTTTDQNVEMLIRLGVKKSKIYKYPFSSVLKEDIKKNSSLVLEKEYIKKKLNISEDKIILTVGQFIYRKGFDVLLNAVSNIKSDYGVYIIGGNPTEEYKRIIKEKKLKNIHFIGFQTKNELKNFYAIADIFVLPTREDIWGLVINEAMSYGLPIITTYKCGAGLEMIENGKNGFLVDVGDEKMLAQKIIYLLENDELRAKIRKENLEKIEKYTIEEMALSHIKILSQLEE